VPLKAPATVEENVAAPVTPRVELKLPVVADKAAGVVPPIAVPSIVPELMSIPVTGVVPSSRLSRLSRLVFSFSPHVSSEAPTSGLVKP
jgi:hypothetical protein